MAASITDLFNEPTTTTRPDAAALTAQKLIGAASITVDTTAGWPTATAVHLVIYQVTAAGTRVEGTQTEWKGIVTSATAIGTLTLQAGTDQVYPIGSKVICTPTAAWGDDLVEGILVEHEQDGTHGVEIVTSRTEDTSPDPDADFLLTYDTSATALKKVKPSSLGIGDSWVRNSLPAVSSVTENGNRSADITFASTVANILTPGMRIRTSRTVAAPTGAILLNGTTQYASKTTPAGMTFTNNFVVDAYVRLTAYQGATIVSRYNGTSGWVLDINSSGQVRLVGYNAGAGNYSLLTAYQSLPLNKWVRVSAQLDMTVTTNTATTNYVMLDGADVPAFVTRAGTSPVALVQAGDLQVGVQNGAIFFPGNIAQVAIFNAKVTQATLRGYKNQSFSGSETSLISAYKLDQASGLNDLNANANNLTATGSPTYSVASPFTTDANGTPAGTYDWAIVTKVATTVATVQYPEGCAIPTSGGISTVDYSGVKAPFGMPVSKNKWRINSLLRTASATTSNATYGAFQAGGWALNAQVGEWDLGWRAGYVDNAATTAVTFNISSTALTGLTLAAGNNASPYAQAIQSSAAALTSVPMYSSQPQSLTAAVTYTMYSIGATTNCGIEGTQGTAEIFADLAYL